MANLIDIVKMTAMLSAAYPNWNITAATNEIYYQDLKDIPSDELFTAAQMCRSEAGRKFAPSVGELRGAVLELRRMAVNIPSSYEAWREFLRYVNDGRPVSPLTRKTIDVLGERNLRMSENQTSDRMRFVEAYEQLQQRAERIEMLLPEVRGYLEVNGAMLPAPATQMKLLADKMSVKR
jgi:hypothetical protein